MKFICIFLVILFSSSNWQIYENTNNKITIKSTIKINKNKFKKIIIMYKDIKKQFLLFENSKCIPTNTLNMFVISEKEINDIRYFVQARPGHIIFGRYYKPNNELYITPEFFKVPKYFAHELAHYFYDECGFIFKNNVAEEKRTYEFQNFYGEY